MKKIFILSFLISSAFAVSSQITDSTYLRYLSNNKKPPKRVYYNQTKNFKNNIIKTDIFSIFDGNIPIIWEHTFSDSFSFSGGLGVLAPYCFNQFLKNDHSSNFLIYNLNFSNKDYGISCEIEPKFLLSRTGYFFDEGSTYLSLFYKRRMYSSLDIDFVGMGYGWIKNYQNLSLQFSIGGGIRFQSCKDGNNELKYVKLGNDGFSNETKSKDLAMTARFQIGFILPRKNNK